MTYKNLLYCILCLSFSIIIGAAVFEHLVIWPKAYSAPPSSLQMFQEPYGVQAGSFWAPIHPITLLLFLISLIIFWKSERKIHLLLPFLAYLAILIITKIYFVPELMDIINTPFSNDVDPGLIKRGQLWESLSLVRLAFLIAMVIFMYLGLTKGVIKKQS